MSPKIEEVFNHTHFDPFMFSDGNSFDMRDGREASFEVDHLATYTSKSG